MVRQSVGKPAKLIGPCPKCGDELAWHKKADVGGSEYICCAKMSCHCTNRPPI